MKRIIPVLLISLLLCSCGFSQDRTSEVFEVEEIKGSTYFTDVPALTNKVNVPFSLFVKAGTSVK